MPAQVQRESAEDHLFLNHTDTRTQLRAELQHRFEQATVFFSDSHLHQSVVIGLVGSTADEMNHPPADRLKKKTAPSE